MEKHCKKLLKNNNKRGKEIHKNNKKILTDMIVYLRGSDMTMYNQELVREDLIQMIIDGQNRGDDIQKVIGDNYKEICDEVIETMPKKTKSQKIWDILELSVSFIWILGGISVAKIVIGNFITSNESRGFILSIGDIINMLIIILVANIIIDYTCKTSFNNKGKNKVISFIKTWIVCMLVFGIMFMCSYYLDYTIVNIPLMLAAIIVGIVFILDRILSMHIV